MSETNASKRHPFVSHLESLHEADDRQALAALRRGLGRPLGAAPEMYPYVVPWLPSEASYQEEQNYYLVAALYASHPASARTGNVGDHLRAVCKTDAKREAGVERRFTVLLSVHRDDLPDHLRQTISLLRSHEIPVNWHQLWSDLRWWDHPDAFVQRQWARAFWAAAAVPEAEAPTDAQNGQE